MATVLPKTTVLERLQRGRLYGAVHLRDPVLHWTGSWTHVYVGCLELITREMLHLSDTTASANGETWAIGIKGENEDALVLGCQIRTITLFNGLPPQIPLAGSSAVTVL